MHITRYAYSALLIIGAVLAVLLLSACSTVAMNPMIAPATASADAPLRDKEADQAACEAADARTPTAGEWASTSLFNALGIAAVATGYRGPVWLYGPKTSHGTYRDCMLAKGWEAVPLSTHTGDGMTTPGL